jgi:autotransporter adhesin
MALSIRFPTATTRRRRFTLLAIVGALALSSSPAIAGCNSGDIANTLLLSSGGCRANATGEDAVAIGREADAPGGRSVALGFGAGDIFAGAGSTSIGANSQATGIWSTALGAGLFIIDHVTAARAVGQYSVAIGGGDSDANPGAWAGNTFGVAIGTGSVAWGVRSTAVGSFAGDTAGGGNAYNSAFGDGAGRFVTGQGNTGLGLVSGYQVTGDLNSAWGNSAGQTVTGNRNTAGGVLAGRTVNGSFNVALGDTAGNNINASHTVAIGTEARASANNAVAIGHSAAATRLRAVALGSGSVASASDTVSVGSGSLKRRIVNVANAVNPNDAVNLAQLQAATAAINELRALVQRQQQEIAELRGHKSAASAR